MLLLDEKFNRCSKELARSIKMVKRHYIRLETLKEYLHTHTKYGGPMAYPPDYALLANLIKKQTYTHSFDKEIRLLILDWAINKSKDPDAKVLIFNNIN